MRRALSLIAILAFLLMGYHPGLEDDVFYLAAIKRDLNPALFPHDADFFRLQFQATIFDRLIALSVRVTHLPLSWAVLLWQFAAIFLLLYGSWRISRHCFSRPEAQWAAVALLAALLTLPVSGSGLNIADQYLHPRGIATAAIVTAIAEILDRRLWVAGLLLGFAFAIHAIMAVFGISFCLFLWWRLHAEPFPSMSAVPSLAAVALPFGWLFEPGSAAWRQAAATRSFYFITHWEWYEWLGIFAPLVLLLICHRLVKSHSSPPHGPVLRPFVSAVLYYGCFQTIVALALLLPPSLERVRPFEPMRYLHLLYIFFFLLAGGFLGSYVLKQKLFRWALLFIPLSAGMFYAQRQLFPASSHLELPFLQSHNPWMQAFTWIGRNTPVDSLFAIDAHYEIRPGEDYHGFRALAERSVLADYEKDGGMAARVPRLAPVWLKEVTALTGWQQFGDADFQRLNADFGVNWIVLSRGDAAYSTPDPAVMTCPYQNEGVKVCRLNPASFAVNARR